VTGARDEVLSRVRNAINGSAVPAISRSYRQDARDANIELFVDRLRDYKANVVRCSAVGYHSALKANLDAAAISQVVVPAGLATDWWPPGYETTVDDGSLTPAFLDAAGVAVITTCTAGIAETGTIVLDGSAGQGRRMLTLVPDHHLCIIPTDRVVADVPGAIRLLDATRALTWISGPSATSDIELHRVEGVHGPRNLSVFIIEQ
jgi:L-lactate dehydrogenase complex protein LldG